MKRFDKDLKWWPGISILASIAVVYGNTIIQDYNYSPIDILALILAVLVCWLPTIYYSVMWNKQKWDYLSFMETAEVFDISFKRKVQSLHQAFKDKVISEEELFKKLVPFLDEAEKTSNDQNQRIIKEAEVTEITAKIEKIKEAYANGVISEKEMKEKIDNCSPSNKN
jgi:hypothetical protein